MDNVFFFDLLRYFGLLDFCDIEFEVERFIDVFFMEVDEYMYIFFYDSVFEVVGVYFCEIYVIEIVKYFLFDIIWD